MTRLTNLVLPAISFSKKQKTKNQFHLNFGIIIIILFPVNHKRRMLCWRGPKLDGCVLDRPAASTRMLFRFSSSTVVVVVVVGSPLSLAVPARSAVSFSSSIPIGKFAFFMIFKGSLFFFFFLLLLMADARRQQKDKNFFFSQSELNCGLDWSRYILLVVV